MQQKKKMQSGRKDIQYSDNPHADVDKRIKYWVNEIDKMSHIDKQEEYSSTSNTEVYENEKERIEKQLIQDLKLCTEIAQKYANKRNSKDGLVSTILTPIEEQEENIWCSLLYSLKNAILYLDEPLIALDHLVKIFRSGGILGMNSALIIIPIITEYGGEVEDFFRIFHNLLTLDVIEKERDKVLLICECLFKFENISLTAVKCFIKRLSYLSIRTDCFTAAKIMKVICNGLVLHKKAVVSYANRKEMENLAEYERFQPYLYEIDTLKSHPLLSEYAKKIKCLIPIDIDTDKDIKRKINQYVIS